MPGPGPEPASQPRNGLATRRSMSALHMPAFQTDVSNVVVPILNEGKQGLEDADALVQAMEQQIHKTQKVQRGVADTQTALTVKVDDVKKQIDISDEYTLFGEPNTMYEVKYPNKDIKVRVK